MVLGSLFYLSLNDDVEVKFVQDFEACFCKYVPLAKSFFLMFTFCFLLKSVDLSSDAIHE